MKDTVKKILFTNPYLGKVLFPKLKRLYKAFDSRKIYSQAHTLRQFRSMGFDPKSVFDIGAHRGEWSVECASVFPSARYFLFEPQHEMEDFLAYSMRNISNCHVEFIGLGAEKSSLELTIWDDFAGSSFVPARAHMDVNQKQKRVVPVSTVDIFLLENSLNAPDFIKIDVQGFELEVLRGASTCFGRTEVFLLEASFFEFLPGQPTFFEVVEFMKRNGYVCFDIVDKILRPSDNAPAQVDMFFVRENGFFRANNSW